MICTFHFPLPADWIALLPAAAAATASSIFHLALDTTRALLHCIALLPRRSLLEASMRVRDVSAAECF
jgi:hypothetical protein